MCMCRPVKVKVVLFSGMIRILRENYNLHYDSNDTNEIDSYCKVQMFGGGEFLLVCFNLFIVHIVINLEVKI